MQGGDEFRHRREQYTAEIRSKNREEILSKRRNITTPSSSTVNTGVTETSTNSKHHIIDQRFKEKISEYHNETASREHFMQYLTAIHSPDCLEQHQGVIMIRKLLTNNNSPPIQQVIDAGLVPKLINYSKQKEYPQLQLEAVWCLTNIAAGNTQQTGSVIDKGGIKIFVELLVSEHIGIIEQAVWALGNIASDQPSYRDSIIKSGGLSNLVKVIEAAINELPKTPGIKDIIESSIWTLSAICRTKPLPNYTLIKETLPVFYYVIINNLIADINIVGNVCWAISYFTNNKKEGPKKEDKIQACISSGVVPHLLKHLDSNVDTLCVAILKTLGNLALGNEEQCEYLISIGIVGKLAEVLHREKKVLRKEATWTFSNLAESSPKHIEAIFGYPNLVPKLMSMLKSDLPDVRTELCYLFANAIDNGENEKMYQFITEINLLKEIGEIFSTSTDSSEIESSLQCMDAILNLGKVLYDKKNNVFVKEIMRLKLVPKLEELQYHEVDEIYDQASKIISTYFDLENPLNL